MKDPVLLQRAGSPSSSSGHRVLLGLPARQVLAAAKVHMIDARSFTYPPIYISVPISASSLWMPPPHNRNGRSTVHSRPEFRFGFGFRFSGLKSVPGWVSHSKGDTKSTWCEQNSREQLDHPRIHHIHRTASPSRLISRRTLLKRSVRDSTQINIKLIDYLKGFIIFY